MLKNSPALWNTIRRNSKRVWQDLEVGDRYGVSPSEESITDYLLLDLVREHHSEVRIHKFTRREEGKKTGADWEWWFGSEGAWFGMRVQAKRLKHQGNPGYPSLLQKAGKTSKLQVDLLIEDAKSRSLYPMYCFYNFLPNFAHYGIRWACTPECSDEKFWGCSIADAQAVKTNIDSKFYDFSSIGKISSPLMCIFRCNEHDVDGRKLANIAHDEVTLLSNKCLRKNAPAVPEVVAKLPTYVELSRNGDPNNDISPDIQAKLDGIMVVLG